MLRRLSTKVFPAIKTSAELDSLLSSPTWSVSDCFSEEVSTIKVTSETVSKLLKLSALPHTDENLVPVLQNQLKFINKLHSVEADNDASHSRILPRQTKPISYKSLMEQIEQQKQDPSKGETGNWDSTCCAKITENHSFVIREGLKAKV